MKYKVEHKIFIPPLEDTSLLQRDVPYKKL